MAFPQRNDKVTRIGVDVKQDGLVYFRGFITSKSGQRFELTCVKQNEKGNLKLATKKDYVFISVWFSNWKDPLDDFRSHQ